LEGLIEAKLIENKQTRVGFRLVLEETRDTQCAQCYRWLARLTLHDKNYFCDSSCRNGYRYEIAQQIASYNGIEQYHQLLAGWKEHGSSYLDAWQKTYCPNRDLSQENKS
jgi:hypothetical protein